MPYKDSAQKKLYAHTYWTKNKAHLGPARKVYSKKWYGENREKRIAYGLEYNRTEQAWTAQHKYDKSDRRRDLNYQKNYGITLEQYEILFDRQNGLCLICSRPPKQGKLLHVDHNHQTNKIRGLLCGDCNHLLGFANDDPAILDKAMTYLREEQLAANSTS